MTATRLAAGAHAGVLGRRPPRATIWPVDAELRPEGRQGALVRTLAILHAPTTTRWARTWEFQALLKARPVAGDLALGEAYVDARAAAGRGARPSDRTSSRTCRRCAAGSRSTCPAKEAERQLKLGRGGLRDVEFAVQLLQLVHGRTDVFAPQPVTRSMALEQLSTHGYVGRDDAAELDRAYRFLRTLEHRLQLHRLRRTHVVPDDEAELRRLGRSMGFAERPGRRS